MSLFIPRNTRHFSIVNENFISRGYGLATKIIKGNRKVVWSIRNAKGKQSLYYSASVRRVVRGERTTTAAPPAIEMPKFEGAHLEAATSIITQIRQQSADADSMVTELFKYLNKPQPDDNVTLLLGKEPDIAKKVHLAVDLLSQAGNLHVPFMASCWKDLDAICLSCTGLRCSSKRSGSRMIPSPAMKGYPMTIFHGGRGRGPWSSSRVEMDFTQPYQLILIWRKRYDPLLNEVE